MDEVFYGLTTKPFQFGAAPAFDFDSTAYRGAVASLDFGAPTVAELAQEGT